MNNGMPTYVFKTSKLAVELALQMDKDGEGFMSQEYCFLDAKHDRCRGFKTLTLWVYHPLLRELFKLATAEVEAETGDTIAVFFQAFNRALQESKNDPSYKFNPRGWVFDEHGGNWNAVRDVFGEDALARCKSCDFHFKDCRNRHRNKLTSEEEKKMFTNMTDKLLYSASTAAYNQVLEDLMAFLSTPERKHLKCWIEWWHVRRHHVFRAWCPRGAPSTNLAEIGHSKWAKQGSENLDLVTAAKEDVAESILQEKAVEQFKLGVYSGGSGPSLAQREEKTAREQGVSLGPTMVAYLLSGMDGVHFWLFPGLTPSTDLEVTSDAAGALDYGAFYGQDWFNGLCTQMPDHRFQQDNDPKHTSKKAQEYYRQSGINWWPTPAESPDLNPIECIWNQLKYHLRRRVKPSNKEELVNGIKDFWATQMTQEQCREYIEHIRIKVIPKVIEVAGQATETGTTCKANCTKSTQTILETPSVEIEPISDLVGDHEDDSWMETPDDPTWLPTTAENECYDNTEETGLDYMGKNIREEPKGIVFLSKLLLLFQSCHLCFFPNPKVTVSQIGTMISITTSCINCKQDFTWNSQPTILGKFPAGNILLSFAILCAGASTNKVLLVFRHMGLVAYHYPAYYYHQRHLLVPAIVKFWRSYQAKILTSLKDKDVVLAGDGRHDSMGHSAKYGTYTIFCCTVGLIIHIVLLQANQCGASSKMEFEGHQQAFTFLLATDMIIKTFISDRHKSIAKWLRVECPKKCKELGKPVITHFFDLWHIAKRSEAYCKLYDALTNKTLLKAIKQASPIAQTSSLEGYHSVINQFAPKMLAFSYLGMLSSQRIESDPKL
ncbi:hypothetical protein QZH41_007880 [Actinostola sp. cb2023]|nr:hypothetical protein QZH41_007880 [Actinostola sp. cb2023]